MNHYHVDEKALPERFLSGTLPPAEHCEFALHYQECEECRDRVELARIWLEEGLTVQAGTSAHDPPLSKSSGRPRPDPNFHDSWQPVAVARLTAMLAIAIHYSQIQRPFEPEEPIPMRARFVAQWTPWQLVAFASAAALVLVLIPATYFLWEFQKLGAFR
jgi:hypothetical protein